MTFFEYFSIYFYLFFSFLIFITGVSGLILWRKNLIIVLISLEIIFLAIQMNFLLFSVFLDDILGYIFSIFILVIAGSEVSIGLALIILLYRLQKVIYTDTLSLLKG